MRERSPTLLRMGIVSLVCWLHLCRAGRPYAMEVLFHAGDVTRDVKNIQTLGLARVLATLLHRVCRLQVSGAALASYVSPHLARLYPTARGRQWVISDVHLPEAAFASPRPSASFARAVKRLIVVGRVAPEKGQDLLLHALARVRSAGGPHFSLDVVGPGALAELEALAKELGLADRVRFHGAVPAGEPVRRLLDASDIFVLPSRTEGMPRALLEALARGVPALSARVGGVAEVLPDSCLVPTGDSEALARGIHDLCASAPERLAELSRAGVDVARRYHDDVLRERRDEFWRALAELG
jgi:glycosyltransferase involved in cell wall biosynthesis